MPAFRESIKRGFVLELDAKVSSPPSSASPGPYTLNTADEIAAATRLGVDAGPSQPRIRQHRPRRHRAAGAASALPVVPASQPTEPTGDNGVMAKPAKKLTVLACMDARLDPARLFGLEPGDAHVIRNAGGAASDDAIRSIAVSQHLLGTEEVAIVHHTDCGMQKTSEEGFAELMRERVGELPPWPVLAFEDLEGNLRAQIRAIEGSPFIPRTDRVRGYVFDVDTGELRELDREA